MGQAPPDRDRSTQGSPFPFYTSNAPTSPSFQGPHKDLIFCSFILFYILFFPSLAYCLYTPRPAQNRTEQNHPRAGRHWAQSVPVLPLTQTYSSRPMSRPSPPHVSPVAVETLHNWPLLRAHVWISYGICPDNLDNRHIPLLSARLTVFGDFERSCFFS